MRRADQEWTALDPWEGLAFSWLTYPARAHWSAADSQAPLRGVSIAKAIVRHTGLSLPGRAIPDRRQAAVVDLDPNRRADRQSGSFQRSGSDKATGHEVAVMYNLP